MKKALPVCFLFILAMWGNSCTKCYNCTNSCQQCAYQDTSGAAVQFTLCQDSFASNQQFQMAIDSDIAHGFVCHSTAATYNETFCTNKPGEAYFPSYYNRGGRVNCIEQ